MLVPWVGPSRAASLCSKAWPQEHSLLATLPRVRRGPCAGCLSRRGVGGCEPRPQSPAPEPRPRPAGGALWLPWLDCYIVTSVVAVTAVEAWAAPATAGANLRVRMEGPRGPAVC